MSNESREQPGSANDPEVLNEWQLERGRQAGEQNRM